MTINIMTTEDRSGRSGDHIPFRQKGFPSIRFCSANEHGNGRGNYPDRQHSTRDVLGVDTDDDGIFDTLYVDPGYLQRNTLINAATLANLANSAPAQSYAFEPIPSGVRITIENPDADIDAYRVGVRYRLSRSHDFDEVYYFDAANQIDVLVDPGSRCFISVAAVKKGFIGQFSPEYNLNLTNIDFLKYSGVLSIEEIYPNPGVNTLSIVFNRSGQNIQDQYIQIVDLLGRKIHAEPVKSFDNQQIHSVDISFLKPGVYLISIVSDGIQSKTHRFLKTI